AFRRRVVDDEDIRALDASGDLKSEAPCNARRGRAAVDDRDRPHAERPRQRTRAHQVAEAHLRARGDTEDAPKRRRLAHGHPISVPSVSMTRSTSSLVMAAESGSESV